MLNIAACVTALKGDGRAAVIGYCLGDSYVGYNYAWVTAMPGFQLCLGFSFATAG
jgi:hypothetical protein